MFYWKQNNKGTNLNIFGMLDVNDIIKKFDLQPHPEGGHFKRIYTSELTCQVGDKEKESPLSSAILYLLERHEFSAVHKITQDETWHFHAGSPIELVHISESASYRCITLGCDYENGHLPIYTVPGKHYFFARPMSSEHHFSLVSCSVTPGFDYDGFYMPSAEEFLKEFPVLGKRFAQYCTS